MARLHVCWLVDPWRTSREKYLAAWAALGWDVALWARFDVSGQPVRAFEVPPGVTVYDPEAVISGSPIEPAVRHAVLHGDHATAADLFRYEVLLRLGGAYSDVDVMPLSGSVPEAMLRDGPVFGADRGGRMEIRFIASPAGHPVLRRLRDTAVANADAFIAAGGWAARMAGARGILKRTGPKMARAVLAGMEPEHRLVLVDAVDENTPENAESHFFEKGPEAKRIAAGRSVE